MTERGFWCAFFLDLFLFTIFSWSCSASINSLAFQLFMERPGPMNNHSQVNVVLFAAAEGCLWWAWKLPGSEQWVHEVTETEAGEIRTFRDQSCLSTNICEEGKVDLTGKTYFKCTRGGSPRLFQVPFLVIPRDYDKEKGRHSKESGSNSNSALPMLQRLQGKCPFYFLVYSYIYLSTWFFGFGCFHSVTASENGRGIKPLIQIFPQTSRKIVETCYLKYFIKCKLFSLKVVYQRLISRHTTDLIKPPAEQLYKCDFKY